VRSRQLNTQLPYKTVKEFTDAAKMASPPFKMGGNRLAPRGPFLTVFLEKKTGAKFAYLPYKSGGEAATQLVGNQPPPTSTTVGKSRSLALRPGCGRSVRSTMSGSNTRPR